MKNEEFISQWIYSPLIKANFESVKDLNIPTSSKQFLCEVGLPRYAEPNFMFDLEKKEFPLISQLEKNKYKKLDERFGFYRQIGVHFASAICLDESNNGSIIVVHSFVTPMVVFINSSIEQLMEFLIHYNESSKLADPEKMKELEELEDFEDIEDKSKEIIKKINVILFNELKRIDPKVLEDENNFWMRQLWEEEMGLS